MGTVFQALAAHAATAGYLSGHRAWHYIAGGGVPNPPAQAPPGLTGPSPTRLIKGG